MSDNSNSKYSVSVVIPFYNAEQMILQTMSTLMEALAHSRLVERYEVICVDDASADHTRMLLDEYYPSVRVLTIKERAYYIEAANKGMFRCRHDYVLLLTQGLFLPQDYFDVMLPYFDRENTYIVSAMLKNGTEQVSFRHLPVFQDGRVEYEKDPLNMSGNSIMLERGNLLMKRETMLTMGGYDTLFSAYSTADFELSLRGWSYGCRSVFVNEISCQIIKPSAESQDWDRKEEKGEEDWNEMLMHIYFDHGWRLTRYMARMSLFFILSLIIPLSMFHRTRWAFSRLIRNRNTVLNERMWKYGHMKYNLKEIADYYFK